MIVKSRGLFLLLLVGMLVIGILSVSADATVVVGEDNFVIPSAANITYNDSSTCNFTIENFSASIMKINSSELDNYIHSNRLKKYEVIKLSDEQNNYYRYDDRLHNERGVVTPMQMDHGSYIFKLYKYDSFSGPLKADVPGNRAKFMGIFRGFLQKNQHGHLVNYGGLPI